MTEFVCANCFEDEGVRNFIRDFGDQNPDEQGQCSYCDNEDGVDVDRVAKYILNERLLPEWEDAANCSPYDGKNGGFLYPTSDTYDIITDGELGIGIDNDDLRNDIINALPDNLWVSKGFFADWANDYPIWNWDDFCRYVKHRHRYFFPREDVRGVLDNIIAQLANDAVVPCQTPIYRARVGLFVKESDIREPPPEQAAASNRMNPAGIRMFYGCDYLDASRSEVYDKARAEDGDVITVGEFAIKVSFNVFNIWIPSAEDEDSESEAIRVLGEFRKQIAKRIPKDGIKDIEYVPAQIFTEYLRTNPESLGKEIGGIAYPSAKDREWTCVALFDSEHLQLVKLRHYRVFLRKDEDGNIQRDKDGHPEIEFERMHLDSAQGNQV